MPLDTDAFHYRGLTAASAAMRRVFSLLERLERSREAVLVSGETGVGKERVARAIHSASPVSSGPFVVLDASLLAARAADGIDVVGEVKEAFTSATGGTLFVREIELLPPATQALLSDLLVDSASKVRLLSSTTRSLEDEAQQGRFSTALYDKIATTRLFVPPLRHRPEDVAVLARVFANEVGARPLAPAIVADLAARQWPGNIAELRDTVLSSVNERAVRESGIAPAIDVTTGAPVGLDEALEALVDISVPYVDLKEQLVARFTRIYLARLLKHTKGNRSEAARIAHLDRTYLGRLVGKLGVRVP